MVPNSVFKDDVLGSFMIDALPMKHTALEIIAVNKLLSERETSGLADTKSQYQFDPVALAAKHRYASYNFTFDAI